MDSFNSSGGDDDLLNSEVPPTEPNNRQQHCHPVRMIIYSAVTLASLLSTVAITFQLFLFFSGNRYGYLGGITGTEEDPDVFLAMISNISFTLLFIATHSLLATQKVKGVFSYLSITPLHRSIYNLVTAVSLKVLVDNWYVVLPSTFTSVWEMKSSSSFVSFCELTQLVAWFYMLCVIYILDFNEFIGVKQIIYHFNAEGCPLRNKSRRAQSYFNNMRHPCLLCPFLIFFAVPCMTLDRLFLSLGFVFYLLMQSELDDNNLRYISRMYTRKKRRLSH